MESKYAAIMIIISVSVYIALCVKRRYRYKLYLGRALCDFIEYVKNQIEFFCTPAREILESYNDHFLSECGLLPIGDEELEDKLIKCELSSYVEPEVMNLLCSFARRFGRCSAQEQIANCEYTLAELRKHIDEQKTDLPKRSKMYSTLSVVLGCMVAILLL